MSFLKVTSIGYHHEHESTFCIDRPNGMGDNWLFLLIKSPAIFRIDGIDYMVRPDSFILYPAGMPEWYSACEETYIDDWIHFTASGADAALLQKLGIPFGVPTHLGQISGLSAVIRNMTYEFYSEKPYKEEIVRLQLFHVFYQLARLLLGTVAEQGNGIHDDALVRLRQRIYQDTRKIGSVEEMAKELSMSQSSFQHTYKKLFGCSVTADISESRILHAQNLLTSTTLTLREVAEQSGYSGEFHFMRHFKQHTGMTPTEYREHSR